MEQKSQMPGEARQNALNEKDMRAAIAAMLDRMTRMHADGENFSTLLAALCLRCGFLDHDFYLQKYPDVIEAGIEPAMHYVCHGYGEGRAPNAAVDENRLARFMNERFDGGDFRSFLEHLLNFLQEDSEARAAAEGEEESAAKESDGIASSIDARPESEGADEALARR